MRRILAFLVIAALLTANLEVVTDLEEAWSRNAPPATAATVIDGGSSGVPSLPDSDVGCDHCCHAGAHLAGLVHCVMQAERIVVTAAPPDTTGLFSSVIPSRSLRPPIA